MNQIALQESFMWAQDLYPVLKQYESDGSSFYKVLANHADIRNLNGRVYIAKELQAAASSLSERPLNINHDPARELPFPENQVLAARYEDGVVECIIQVSDRKTKSMIDSGEISKVSVEGIYLNEANNTKDTEFPTSLHFRALALLTSDDSPGDPLTAILKDHAISEGRTIIIEKIILDGEWSNSFVNELPDSSFAAISPGGKKDEQGKTTPRSLRHLPYKDANGNINKAHLQNALARLSQTELSPQLKSAARKKLVSAAKQVGIQTSMDEAYQNFKVAKEILRAIFDDDDPDADKDLMVNPDKSKDQEIPNPQTDYSKADSLRLDPQTVPGATTSKIDAEVAGPVKETPEMDPARKMNPGLKMSPTAITNEHLTKTKKPITVTISK